MAQPRRRGPTLYVQIADTLAQRIEHMRPGTSLPAEKDLAWEFDTSSATIGAALDLLQARGLIRRDRGRVAAVRQLPDPVVVAMADIEAVEFRLPSLEESKILDVPPGAWVAQLRYPGGAVRVVPIDRLRLER